MGKAKILGAILLVAFISASFVMAGADDATTDIARFDVAHAKGIGPRRASVATQPNQGVQSKLQDHEEIDRDLDLFGQIVDQDDQPVEGAKVTTMTHPWRRGRALYSPKGSGEISGPATLSAADGSFRIPLKRGDMANLTVQAKGFGVVDLPGCQAGQKVNVRLESPASLEVLCVNSDGKAVAGGLVQVLGISELGSPALKTATSDSQGHARFNNLSGGSNLIICKDTGYVSPAYTRVAVRSGQSSTAKVILLSGRIVIGEVIDAMTGKPVPNARVDTSRGDQDAFVLTDKEGTFRIHTQVAGRRNSVTVLAKGYASMMRPVTDKPTMRFELLRGDRVTGLLVGADGQAVAGAHVQVAGSQRVNGEQETDSGGCRSDSKGRFEIQDLRRTMAHTLIVVAEGHGRFLLDFDPNAEKPGPIDLGTIQLPTAHRLEGVVVDHAGKPVEGVQIVISGHNSDRGRLRPNEPLAYDTFYGTEESRHTDDLGRFRFSNLSEGEYTVRLNVGTHRNLPVKVRLDEDKDKTDLKFTIEHTGVLRFLCLDQAGNPLAGVSISARVSRDHGDGRPPRGKSGIDGIAEIRFVPEEEYTIRAFPPSGYFSPPPFQASPNQEIVTIHLSRSSKLAGTVFAKDVPVKRCRIYLTWGANETKIVDSDAFGRFSTRVPHGAVVSLHAQNFWRKKGEPVLVGSLKRLVAPYEKLKIKIAPAPMGRELTVLVLGPDGQPAPGSQVLKGHQNSLGKANDKGLLHLRNLTGARFPVKARPARSEMSNHKQYPSILRHVVPAGQQVTLRLQEVILFKGRLVDTKGNAKRAEEVTTQIGDQYFRSGTIDEAGRFEIYIVKAPFWNFDVSIPNENKTIGIKVMAADQMPETTLTVK